MAVFEFLLKSLLYIGGAVGCILLIWLAFNALALVLYVAVMLLVLMFNVALPWRWKEIRWEGWPHHAEAFRAFKGELAMGLLESVGKNKAGSTSGSSTSTTKRPERVIIEMQYRNGIWGQLDTTTSDSVDIAIIKYQNYRISPTHSGRARARGAESGALYASWEMGS